MANYKWTNTEVIQLYLSGASSTIQIGDPSDGSKAFAEESSRLLENEAVFEIESFLSIIWKVPFPLDDIENQDDKEIDNTDLGSMAAKSTASKIGVMSVGSALGQIPYWTYRFKNEIYAQCQRMVLNWRTFHLIKGSGNGSVDLDGLNVDPYTNKITSGYNDNTYLFKKNDVLIPKFADLLTLMKAREITVIDDPSR